MSIGIPSRPTMYRLRPPARNEAALRSHSQRDQWVMVCSTALRAADFPWEVLNELQNAATWPFRQRSYSGRVSFSFFATSAISLSRAMFTMPLESSERLWRKRFTRRALSRALFTRDRGTRNLSAGCWGGEQARALPRHEVVRSACESPAVCPIPCTLRKTKATAMAARVRQLFATSLPPSRRRAFSTPVE